MTADAALVLAGLIATAAFAMCAVLAYQLVLLRADVERLRTWCAENASVPGPQGPPGPTGPSDEVSGEPFGDPDGIDWLNASPLVGWAPWEDSR